MRSIGKKNINKVRTLVKEARSKDIIQYDAVFEYVKEKLDLAVFETWEGAYTQIENICHDAS